MSGQGACLICRKSSATPMRPKSAAVGAYGLRLHYHPAAALFGLIGVALLFLQIRHAPWPDILTWTAAFVVAGAIVYGPLLDVVVGTASGGVTVGP
jgi:hypothetical protein